MGGADKIWSPLDGHPVVWYSVKRLAAAVDAVCLVVRADHVERAKHELQDVDRRLRCVAGGTERQDSVLRGLSALEGVDIVAVHDVARPLATASLLRTGVAALDGYEGAIPVQPLHDTLKQIDTEGAIVKTVDRTMLRLAQTPQIFVMDALVHAYQEAGRSGRTATDDAGLLEAAGYRVRTFPGSPTNFKITTPYDLEIARFLVERGVHR